MTTKRTAAPAELLPLTPLSLGVLLALAEGPCHGYALLSELERQSNGRLKPGTGTLYAALQRMIDEGLLEEAKRPAGEDERRRYYAVTPFGRSVARAELKRLAELMDAAGARRLLPDLRIGWRRRST
jgi:DNA-binding PadR family transcriptional regulator